MRDNLTRPAVWIVRYYCTYSVLCTQQCELSEFHCRSRIRSSSHCRYVWYSMYAHISSCSRAGWSRRPQGWMVCCLAITAVKSHNARAVERKTMDRLAHSVDDRRQAASRRRRAVGGAGSRLVLGRPRLRRRCATPPHTRWTLDSWQRL